MGATARALGRDWFCVDWIHVWERTRLAPHMVPGVQPLPLGNKPPYPHRVHLTHLGILGYEAPAQPNGVIAHGDWGLRPHQVAGVAYIKSRRGTLLADEQRVGKTPQIMYAHDPDDGALVMVGPLAARATWHEWAARRFGKCVDALAGRECSICERVRAIGGSLAPSFVALSGRTLTAEQLCAAQQARVVFMHFAIVPTWRQLFDDIKIGTLGVDEAHLAGVQNRKSLTIESIRFLNTTARRTIFATGTPLYNKPRGLWPILDIVTPGAFGDFWDFARRYCDAKPGAYGWTASGVSHPEELAQRLEQVMLRRTWREIAPKLPPITRTVEIVGLTDSVRDRVETLAARIRSQTGNAKTAVGDLARLRKMYAKEKVLAALAHVGGVTGTRNSIVVWTWHREVAEQLYEKLAANQGEIGAIVHGPIHGDTAPDDRERMIEAARSRSKDIPVVLIATMASLATAVNLSFCSHEVFVELDWNPPNIAQAEMRPFDGTRSIACTYLVADCDVDQKLSDALLVKLETMDKLGLSAGAGSVEDVLRESLHIGDEQTLAMLADAVIAEAMR